MSAFKKATRKAIKLKLAVTGAAGSGKTYSALRLATGLAKGSRIAFIDSENGSASLYSDRFDFDVLDMEPPFSHEKYVAAINDAVKGGYGVIIIDSFSHAWEEILNYKSKLDARGGNSYTNWGDAGNKYKGVLDAVLQSPAHIICCLRSKMDYVQEKDDRGKTVVKKVGLAPIARDGVTYEFTTVWDVDAAHQGQASKDRTGLFTDRIEQITEDHGAKLLQWLETGAPMTPAPAPSLGNGELAQEIQQQVQVASNDRAEAKALYDKLRDVNGALADDIRKRHGSDYAAMKQALQVALETRGAA